jgi:anthranilate 1,2-dioxygenase small subunit
VSEPIPFHVLKRIEELVYDSARFIDDERFEDWAELFVDRCVYKITTRENFDAGLPVGVMYCDSRAMLRDRVLSLRKANLYNPHYDRHLVSNVRVLDVADAVYRVHSSYLVLQTTPAGESRVFSCGKYLDRVVFEGESARFEERIVVMDTGAIFNLLATPI